MAFIITKPLEDHQADELMAINQLASDKILARYPLYKQLNTARTEQAPAMYAWIDSVRLAANNAQSAIKLAVNVSAMRATVKTYKDLLAAL